MYSVNCPTWPAPITINTLGVVDSECKDQKCTFKDCIFVLTLHHINVFVWVSSGHAPVSCTIKIMNVRFILLSDTKCLISLISLCQKCTSATTGRRFVFQYTCEAAYIMFMNCCAKCKWTPWKTWIWCKTGRCTALLFLSVFKCHILTQLFWSQWWQLSVNLKVPYQHCFEEDYETHNEMFL